MKTFRNILAVALGAAALGGCATEYEYDTAKLKSESFTVTSPYVVLDGPAMRYAAHDDAEAEAMPWWHSRNDARLNLRTAQSSYDATDYAVSVQDQQRTSTDQVNDTYYRTTYMYRRGAIGR